MTGWPQGHLKEEGEEGEQVLEAVGRGAGGREELR